MKFTIEYTDKGFIKIGSLCFSPGFRSVSRNGEPQFQFTRTQAKIISYLIDHLENGFHQVPQIEITRFLNDDRLSDIDDDFDKKILSEDVRIRDYFKSANNKIHPAWQKLIKTTKGRDSKMHLDLNWIPEKT